MMRSWLFVPGDQTRKIARAFESASDAIIIDWEDAVAPAAKTAARLVLADLLGSKPVVRPALFVRVNALDSPFFEDDLAALPLAHIAGIVLPKACGPADVVRLANRLTTIEQTAGLPLDRLKIVAVATETAASVLALSDFRQPLARLSGLMWGAEDLAADLGVFENRDHHGDYRAPFLLARNLSLMAATASACMAIDAVFTDYRNLAMLEAECLAAKQDGFNAKAAIHPDQVAVINAAFAPTATELAWARQVVALLDGATGVAVLNGKMIDVPHLRLAQRLLNVGT